MQLEVNTNEGKRRWGQALAWIVLGLVLSALTLHAVRWAATEGPLRDLDPLLLQVWHQATPINSFYGVFLMFWSKLVTAQVIWPFLGFTSWFLWRQNRVNDAVGIFSAVTLPALVALAAKHIYKVPRPNYDWAVEFHWSLAYPSGHVAIIFCLCGMTAFIGHRRGRSALWTTGVVAFTLAATALMAYSRVVLGAHFLSDVLAGIFLGFIWLPISVALRNSISN